MACRLADKRVGRDTDERKGIYVDNGHNPVPRDTAAFTFMWDSETRAYTDKRCYEASFEYYKIIDRITLGMRP
jgi:hypothetical protein